MIDPEYERWQEEVDRLLNDPFLPMQAHRIWEAMEVLASLSPDRTSEGLVSSE